MQITSAKEADIKGILALQAQIYRIDKLASNSSESLKKQRTDKCCDILVAKNEEEVVGTATIYYIQVAARGKPYALLEGLVIDKNERHHGYGSKLFDKCVQTAKHRGCYKMIFTSGADRKEAREFYKKKGFNECGLEFRKDL